jgi:hypothetical protein
MSIRYVIVGVHIFVSGLIGDSSATAGSEVEHLSIEIPAKSEAVEDAISSESLSRKRALFAKEARFGHLDPRAFKNTVILPDIHGDFDSLVKSLWIAFRDVDRQIPLAEFKSHIDTFLIDDELGANKLASKPDDTILVQLGDIVDRGPHGLECLRVMDIIEKAIGWRTVRLYGNHELMSHMGKSGDFIHPEEVKSFDRFYGSQGARNTEFAPGGSLWKHITDVSIMAARIGPSVDPDDISNDLSSDGTFPLSSASTLFVHGGIDLHWIDQVDSGLPDPSRLLRRLNGMANMAFQSTERNERVMVDIIGERTAPLWTRDLAQLDQRYICKRVLPRILKRFQVARIIVGHTPQYDRQMKSLCHSRLILADATMSRWMFTDPLMAKGNPTALVMKQGDGQLYAMHALYYDTATGVLSKQPFFRTDLGGIEFKPNSPQREPDLLDIVSEGDIRRELYPVKFTLEGTGQKISGVYQFELIKKLRTEKPLHSFGLPLVVYQSTMKDNAEFYVIYDTYGTSLRSVADITLAIRRQILEVLWDIWEAGYVLRYTQSQNDPKEVLDMFIIDSITGLVMFVDFARLAYREDDSGGSLQAMIGNIVAELVHIPSEGYAEDVRYSLLILELFGFDSPLVDATIVESEYIVPSGRRRFSARTTVLPPIQELKPPGITSEELYDHSEILSVLPDAVKGWEVRSVDVFSSSGTGVLYRATFGDSSILKITKGIILEVTSCQTHEFALSALIALSGRETTPGIPRMVALKHKSDCGFLAIWDIDPTNMVSLGSEDGLNRAKIACRILETTEYAHSVKVSYALEEPVEDLKQIFFVNKKNSDVWLLDLSGVSMELAPSPGLFEKELMDVVAALGSMFPGITIHDSEASSEAVKAPGSPDKRRRQRAKSFDPDVSMIQSGRSLRLPVLPPIMSTSTETTSSHEYEA